MSPPRYQKYKKKERKIKREFAVFFVVFTFYMYSAFGGVGKKKQARAHPVGLYGTHKISLALLKSILSSYPIGMW